MSQSFQLPPCFQSCCLHHHHQDEEPPVFGWENCQEESAQQWAPIMLNNGLITLVTCLAGAPRVTCVPVVTADNNRCEILVNTSAALGATLCSSLPSPFSFHLLSSIKVLRPPSPTPETGKTFVFSVSTLLFKWFHAGSAACFQTPLEP